MDADRERVVKTRSFTPRFASALLENVVVCIGMVVLTPMLLLARSASHPAMTARSAIIAGLIGGVVALLFYTGLFFRRAPKEAVLDENELLLRWRNGSETRVPWDKVRRAVFRARWGYRWNFFLDASAPILWGDGFSVTAWEQMSDFVEAQLNARSVPIEKFDAYGKRIG